MPPIIDSTIPILKNITVLPPQAFLFIRALNLKENPPAPMNKKPAIKIKILIVNKLCTKSPPGYLYIPLLKIVKLYT